MEEQISVTDERERRYRRLALELGDALKWDVPVNVIHRTAQGILGITDVNEYDVESITSARAQTVYNWVMTLLEAPMEAEEADRRLREFICELLPAESEQRARILRLLQTGPTPTVATAIISISDLHPRMRKAAEALYTDGHYDQAVFEAFKTVENMVKEKAGLTDGIGQALMFKVFDENAPLLIMGDLSTQMGCNRQVGFKFIFAGAMRGIRNIAGHGDLELNPAEGLEHLALASLLARVVDSAEVAGHA